ncbi:hypothetical protein CCMSSC00406_0005832 [Pleurotus cornucopiae]|uniref:Uncharacterized protein n=1 Tax=Pleurotus cornucopiae TaxID=5321 RepID=A0ACB7J944_PLECO|nr:hypothetical protein CCMSSC00406_0005832 [Pleurotus cornucopiae]
MPVPTNTNSKHAFPPFPDDVPTHPLLIVDYALIKAGDEAEKNKLWEAGTNLGFWYLKNHDADEEVNGMFDMGAATMDLPLEEKLQFDQGDSGRSAGYKAIGANAVDETGQKDNVEFINVSQDDAMAWPDVARRTYPRTVTAVMDSVVQPFVRKSAEINLTLMDVFNDKLGLPEGTLRRKHTGELSGSETRCIKSPPKPDWDEKTASLGAHTDFGSLSFLHNRQGGLQVFVKGTDKWQYIKPLPGHAVCNLGDAMAIFSGGILRSNLHRVVPPPGAQAAFDRWSLVFFSRPGDSVVLRALKEDSQLIAEAAEKNQRENGTNYETQSTAADWFARRIKYQRVKNYKGPESWQQSRGTEHKQRV